MSAQSDHDSPSVTIPALTMAVAAGAALALAIAFAPARSGPNCLTQECIEFPYTDVAAYVPTEYWWMYPAAILAPAVVVTLVVLRGGVPGRRQPAAWLAILSAVAASVVLGLAYAIQLMVVQPSLVKGEQEVLALWSQYNPCLLYTSRCV